MDVDYLIIGAGTTGLCVADQLFSDTSATMAIVDRRGMAGGHWADTYPFVELHQPASYYGLPSTSLGSNQKDTAGPNKGLYALASGAEVASHLQTGLRDRLLASGRVHHLPLHEFGEDGQVRSLLTGKTVPFTVRKKTVFAGLFENAIPQTHKRNYGVDEGVACIPPNDLPRRAAGFENYLIVGGGKTAIDAVLFLLRCGADPRSIHWVVPRDSWLINRRCAQAEQEFFADTIGGAADQLEAMAAATSVEDMALRLEACGMWLRIDQGVTPTMFHAATVTETEIDRLRSISNIIRKGRVKQVTPASIHLEQGEETLPPSTLVVDCSASAISRPPTRQVFNGDVINCQLLRFPSVSFSAALIARLETMFDGDLEKNQFANPVPLPDTPKEFCNSYVLGLMNQGAWRQNPGIASFMRSCRLEPFTNLIADGDNSDPARKTILDRMQAAMMPAIMNLQKLSAP